MGRLGADSGYSQSSLLYAHSMHIKKDLTTSRAFKIVRQYVVRCLIRWIAASKSWYCYKYHL